MAITPQPAIWKTLLAFAIVYFVWGSTFLAIRIGVAEVPPFLLADMRFLRLRIVAFERLRWIQSEKPLSSPSKLSENVE
jgi:hypothetical protein